MKIAAIFATFVMLAGSETTSRADDYLSGYLDLGYLHQSTSAYTHGKLELSQGLSTSTLGGVIQYRLDDCAVRSNISESLNIYEERFHGKHVVDHIVHRSSVASTTIGAQAGCRFEKLWIIGLGGSSAPENSNRTNSYGLGLYYIFNDQYRLGFSAQKQIYEDTYFHEDYTYQWMKYTARSSYLINDDLMLSLSLKFEPYDTSKAYAIFSKVEYKLKDRPVSFYAGFGADWSQGDNSFSAKALSATAGLRFYFNDGSLKTIVNNSIPDIGD